MGKLNKFEDVDVFASLEAIMKQNTGFYQSDFDIDRQIIAEKAASPNKEDKTLLWLSRPSGTYCFRERDVFIKDTAPNNTWRFYKEQTRDLILAYAVELTGVQGGKIKGNLYELDYEKHYERVKDNTVDAGTVTLVYEQGSSQQTDALTVIPTPSLESLNALKYSRKTRKPCNPCYGRKSTAGTN